jgi:Secretion system C-terminal sorting domain
MKKALLCLLFCVSFLLSIRAQTYRLIPDHNFANALRTEGFGSAMSGDNLDTSSTLVTSSTTLLCSHASIANLSGIEYFTSLTTLNCSNNNLTALPTLPDSLTTLYCSSNHLTSLPSLPLGLIYLYCDLNSISALPALPSMMQELYCSDNPISTLPPLPTSLLRLDLYNCSVDSILNLPPNLNDFSCGGPSLVYIQDALPWFLTTFSCSYANITQAPTLPGYASSITINHCPHLDSIAGVWSTSLLSFDCSYCNLIRLPYIWDSVESVNCSNNRITTIQLPYGVRTMHCENNNITTLNFGGPMLSELYCQNNNLRLFSNLPWGLTTLYCYDNPALSCLPRLPANLNTLNFSSTSIACLPNIPPTFSCYPTAASVGLCDRMRGSTCPSFWSITGSTFKDDNANCLLDTSEHQLNNMKLQLYSGSTLVQQVNAMNGIYAFDSVPYGVYTIIYDSINSPFNVTCPVAGYDTVNISSARPVVYDKNIALQCKSGFDLGVVSIAPIGSFRPGAVNSISISAGDMAKYFGESCTHTSGSLSLNYSGDISYRGTAVGTPLPDSILSNRLVWNFTDLSLVDFNNCVNPLFMIDSTAVSGEVICFDANISPAGDINPANNNLNLCSVIVSSFDPNLKEVSPSADLSSDAQWLYYTIRFQNTGTSYADHIYILDTLNSFVDISTIQELSSSHQNLMQVLPGKLLKFDFNGIHLMDSLHDEPHSHGYVQYRIKTNSGIPVGTHITNTAGIYFDFNPPVYTNTTNSYVCNPTSSSQTLHLAEGASLTIGAHTYTHSGTYIDLLNNSNGCDSILTTHLQIGTGIESRPLENLISIYPNPVSDILNIQSAAQEVLHIDIYDMRGSLVYHGEMQQRTQISLAALSSGIYTLKLSTAHASLIKKVVKD